MRQEIIFSEVDILKSMVLRRWMLLLFVLCLTLIGFWRPLFELSAKKVIQIFLSLHQWDLVCDGLNWNGEGFDFYGVVLEAKEAFTLKADRVCLSLKQKSIEIESPFLTMHNWKFEDDFPDWKISMRDGTIDAKQFGKARFSMERLHPDQIVHAVFEREGAQLAIEALRKKEAICLYSSWEALPLCELNSWIEEGEFLCGVSKGSAEIAFIAGKKDVKAQLKIENAAIAFGFLKAEEISADLEWQGPLAISPEVLSRIVLEHAKLQIAETSFEISSATLTSFANIGAKIECKTQFPCSIQLRTGFGKEAWLEGEIAFENGALFRFGEQSWECIKIGPKEAGLLQQLASLFYPEAKQLVLDEGEISILGSWNKGWSIEKLEGEKIQVSQGDWILGVETLRFNRDNLSFSGGYFQTPFFQGSGWQGGSELWTGEVENQRANIAFIGSDCVEIQIDGAQAKVSFRWGNHSLTAHFEEGRFAPWQIEGFSMELVADRQQVFCCDLKGEIAKIPFHVPYLSMQGNLWAFDFRIPGPNLDFIRLSGKAQGGSVLFDSEKSHILGAPLCIDSCILGKEGLKKLKLQTNLSLSSLEIARPLLPKQIVDGWDLSELKGEAHLDFDYDRACDSHVSLIGEQVFWRHKPIDLRIAWNKKGSYWAIDCLQIADCGICGKFGWDDGALEIIEAECQMRDYKVSIQARIEIPCTSSHRAFPPESHMRSQSVEVTNLRMSFEGFDRQVSFNNQGPLSIECFSEKGFYISGLNFECKQGHCKANLLKYDSIHKQWVLNHASISLAPEFFSLCNIVLPFALKQNVQMVADVEWRPTDSFFVCKMKEGFIPFRESLCHVRELRLNLQGQEAKAECQWYFEGRPLSLTLQGRWDGEIVGTIMLRDEELERPLVIEWGLKKGGELTFHRIEGCFDGIDASFYSEMNGDLIGSVRFDFSQLGQVLPDWLGKKIGALHLGAGYELKGRLSLNSKKPFFQGILTGKEVELFGYRFRTLFARVEFTQDRLYITDLKLSDSAGILQIKDFLAFQREDSSWVVETPTFCIQELRPSLLQKIGENLGPMTPLIIRELKIENFKGIIGQNETYEGKGELVFINSYRRLHTMYDLPADVIGLLVGLDQELLIPTCGTLRFEVKSGRIHFTELEEAFSQGKRSQFFLTHNEESPYLDLDGTLHILVKMKQFVLFKFTEFFLISIEGNLSDPHFRLQKKKGFFGL